MIYFKSCPRCHGDIQFKHDSMSCLNCGFEIVMMPQPHQIPDVMIKLMGKCESCNKPIEQKERGRLRRTCGGACRTMLYRGKPMYNVVST